MSFTLEKFIDRTVGSFLCILFGISRLIPKSREAPKSILVIKLWAVGESILTLPMIDSLKRKFANAEITVLARKRNADVYTGQKSISNVLLFEPKNFFKLVFTPKKFDLAIDCEPYMNLSALLGFWLAKRRLGFSHGIRSLLYNFAVKFNDAQHEVLTYLDLAKVFNADKKPETLTRLAYSDEDRKLIDKFLKEAGIKKGDLLVGMCAGVAESSKSRMWAKEKWTALADRIIDDYNAKIIFVGAKSEEKHINELASLMKNKIINAAGKTNLKQLFNLVEHCKLFLNVDTGPMHIAAAQGVQTIGLFCPNTPVRFAPYGRKNFSSYKPVLEKPCINVHKGEIPECREHNHMSRISVNDVWKVVQKCLK